MSLRVVSVTGPALLRHGDAHLLVEKEGELVGRVPVEDMAALVLDGPDVVLSHRLLGALASAGVLVVTSDERHLPNGLLLPLAGHSLHSETLRSQIDAPVPSQKRAWQAIVRAKIAAQADLVERIGGDDRPIRRLVPMVRSGDPDNVEANAAARTFCAVFGDKFVRNREEVGVNAALNYGYSIVRGAVARAVVGAGLHPALGIHHHNRYNPLCLADDAIEPLRPLVDFQVWQMLRQDQVADELNPPAKRRLVSVLGAFVRLGDQRFPLLVALERYGANLRRAICEGENLIPPIPFYD